MGGFWYSMTDIGACPALHTDQPCTWRVAEVHKRVHKTCSDELINMAVYNHNQSCFNQCPQPHNSSTTCFSTCFYNTVLGPEFSSKSYDPSTTTMSKTVVGKVRVDTMHRYASSVLPLVAKDMMSCRRFSKRLQTCQREAVWKCNHV
jgi:hypothetical protein